VSSSSGSTNDDEPVPAPPPPPLLGWNVRKLFWGLMVGAVAAGCVWLGYLGLRTWYQQRLAQNARLFLAAGDVRSAALSAQQSLRFNPKNLEAVRVMAQITSAAGVSDAVYWRGRLAELSPTLDNIADWAQAALRNGEIQIADSALARLPSAARNSARSHEMKAALALAARQIARAEFHYAEASRLQPTNEQFQLNLHSIRLKSADPALASAARSGLEQLASTPAFTQPALRALIADAQGQSNQARWLRFAKQAAALNAAEFKDQLMYLDALKSNNDPQFQFHLGKLQDRARDSARDAFLMVEWLNARGFASESLRWSSALDLSIRETPAVRTAIAESYRVLKQWTKLRDFTATGEWRGLDAVRLAFLARSLRELDQRLESRTAWQSASDTVANDPDQQLTLAALVENWGWKMEAEQVWLRLAESSPPPIRRAAMKSLYRLYRTTGDTRKLLRFTAQIVEADRDDAIAQNNLAHLSLLLNQDLERANLIARRNVERFPQEPGFVATLAFACYRQGKFSEAIKLYQSLPEAERNTPATALYYGLALKANGSGDVAEPYFRRAAATPSLLPEERELLNTALSSGGRN
jgi:Flp pilus assembly protein TadD